MRSVQIIKSGNIPLGMRLSFYFIIFGMIIGYFTLITGTMARTKEILNQYSTILKDLAEPAIDPNSLITLIPNMFNEIVNSSDKTQGLNQQIYDIELYQLSGDTWKSIHRMKNISSPVEDEVSILPDKLNRLLNHANSQRISSHNGIFLGFKDSFSFFIRITDKNNPESIVVRITGNRDGLPKIINNSGREFMTFTLSLVLLSIFIGQIFVKRISIPLNRLAKEARRVANGEAHSNFKVKGRDAIAKLAISIDKMNKSLNNKIQRIQRQADAMETMNRIDKAVLSSVSRQDLIHRVSNFTASLYPENGLILLLKNRKGNLDILYDNIAHNHTEHSNELTGDVAEYIIRQIDESGMYRLDAPDIPPSVRNLIPPESEWILIIPVFLQNEQYGALLVTSDLPQGFSEEEVDIVAKLTDQIGVALQSLIHVEAKEALLLGSLKALSAAIDAKSKWTAGHSERVEEISLLIGQEMELTVDFFNKLSIAALLHDIGKLSISETVLDKPDKLTKEEYELIKTHPKTGAEIISHIPEYPEVTQGILYHHEAWDGTGYPEGLRENDIPIIARIICVADVYDALSEERPYRKGMDKKTVIDFFKEHIGKKFDPEITKILINLAETGRI